MEISQRGKPLLKFIQKRAGNTDMIDLEVDCVRQGSVTRVQATVTNGRNTSQRVELRSTLDGPVWAPRAGPLTVIEWSGSTWCGIVPPGRTRGVGFATSAAPSKDPVEVVSIERANDDDVTVESVLEELDRSSPPIDIVPVDP